MGGVPQGAQSGLISVVPGLRDESCGPNASREALRYGVIGSDHSVISFTKSEAEKQLKAKDKRRRLSHAVA
jgi:hypothetical protein